MTNQTALEALQSHPLYRGPIGGAEEGAPAPSGDGGSAPAASPAPASSEGAPAATPTPEPSPAWTKAGALTVPNRPNPLFTAPSGQEGNPLAPAAQPGTPQPAPGAAGGQPPGQPPVAAAPATAPAEPEYLDFGGRQVQVPLDPGPAQALRLAHQDYMRQQATLTRAQQQVAAMRQQTPPVQQPYQAPAAPPPQPQPAQAPPQVVNALAAMTPEQRAAWGERLTQRLFDPEQVHEAARELHEAFSGPELAGIKQELAAAKQVIDELRNQGEWVSQRRQVESFEGQLEAMSSRPDLYPDLDQWRPVMAEILRIQPHLFQRPEPLAEAYRMARGYAPGPGAPAQQQPITVDSVLADPQLAEQIRQRVIQEYATQLRSGAPPALINNAPGGTPPASPPQRPRNLADASAMAKQVFGW